MILQIQHSKLDATKIDTESAIFAHIINELKHTNFVLISPRCKDDAQKKSDQNILENGQYLKLCSKRTFQRKVVPPVYRR